MGTCGACPKSRGATISRLSDRAPSPPSAVHLVALGRSTEAAATRASGSANPTASDCDAAAMRTATADAFPRPDVGSITGMASAVPSASRSLGE
jgi:hypothetical protein